MNEMTTAEAIKSPLRPAPAAQIDDERRENVLLEARDG
jgi:hypothetical protein